MDEVLISLGAMAGRTGGSLSAISQFGKKPNLFPRCAVRPKCDYNETQLT
jgi:hypothetical protein